MSCLRWCSRPDCSHVSDACQYDDVGGAEHAARPLPWVRQVETVFNSAVGDLFGRSLHVPDSHGFYGHFVNTLKLKALLPTESQEAESLWQWAQVARFRESRISDYLIMIPNGAYLGGNVQQRSITMAKLKRQGFKVGASDYLLAIPRGGKHGLFVELKRRSLSVTSPEQTAFQLLMIDMGYDARICKGWEWAKAAIEEYLAL